MNNITKRLIIALLFLLTYTTFISAQNPYYINYNTEDGLPSSETHHTFEDGLGYVWFTTDRGIVKYDGYTFKTFTTNDGLASLVNFNFYKGKGNTFWVNGYDGSLSFWNGIEFIPFKYNWKLKKLINDGPRWFNIINLTETKISFYQDIFKSLPKHFFTIDLSTGEIEKKPFTQNIYFGEYTSDLTRFRVKYKKKLRDTLGEAKDMDGNFWRFTNQETLFYPKGNMNLKPLKYFKGIPISSMYQNNQGNYWFTTLDRGLIYVPSLTINKLNTSNNQNASYSKLKVIDDILVGELTGVTTSLYYRDDSNYVFSKYKDLHKVTSFFNKHSLRKKKYLKIDYSIHRMLELSDDRVLLYTGFSFNLFRIRKENRDPELEFTSPLRILSAVEDNTKILWLGTVDNLYQLNLNDSIYKVIQTPLLEKDSTKTRINDISIIKGNNLWIATMTKGLLYKSTKVHRIKHQKLNNKTIEGLYQLNDTTLWVGTNKGLFKVIHTESSTQGIPKIKKVESFTTQNGLHGNSINDIINWNENLYVATNKGISFFNPKDKYKYQSSPKIYFDEFVVNGKVSDTLINTYNLKYNEKNIKISFTGITLNKPISPESFYRFKLNKDEWSYTNNRSVAYNFLPPNEYTFTIQCQNNIGVWSEAKSIQFIIPPHFTQRLIVRSGFIALIILILIFLFKRRINSTRQKMNKELQYKESELATLRNQMNPHFVFNSLNTLQGYILEGSVLEANEYIGDFASLMRKSLEFSKKNKISISEEIQFIESYLSLEKCRYGDKFDYEIETSFDLKNTSINVIPLMIQPLVENAVKHAFKKNKKNEKGKISVKYTLQNKETMIVQVIDNGSGFDSKNIKETNTSHTSMGIQIVKQRIELTNQKLNSTLYRIEHLNQEKGTTIQLILPIIK